MNVFDRKAKLTQKERVAGGFNGEEACVYDYLKDEVIETLLRFLTTFTHIIFKGCLF